MAKEELLEFDGTVTEVLPDGNYRVTLDNEHQLLAYMSGKMRKFRIRTGVGTAAEFSAALRGWACYSAGADSPSDSSPGAPHEQPRPRPPSP
jgi:translation initiation factor IF-1